MIPTSMVLALRTIMLMFIEYNELKLNGHGSFHFVRLGLPALDIENGHRTILKGLFMSILCVDFSK